MSKMNKFKLVAGVVFLCIFIILSIFGSSLAPYDDEYSLKIGHIQTENGEKLAAAPFPPSKEFKLGTDKWGYDILTLLLYGAKYTIITPIVVGLLRVIIGAVFGIFHALGSNKQFTKQRKTPTTIFTSIPNFIIIYFVLLGININSSYSTTTLILIQGALMLILGISGVYQVVFSKTIELQKNLYILAAQSLGGSRIHVLRKHILPFLWSNLLIILLNECILVLHLIGQLGIFHLFFGGTIMQSDPPVFLSITHEWAGLIGQYRSSLYYSQWIILSPLFAYMLLLFTFYLISSGLSGLQTAKYRKQPYL
jgi:peptide/nickel transport system permease protein